MDTARELTVTLADLLRRERTALGEFLVALADFDAKRRWVDLGYTSLFHFLRAELHLSKAAAQYRKVAAELLQRVPTVVEPLREGKLCFTTIIEVAKVLTPENCDTVLPRFFGMSRGDAMEVVAELQPHPAPPTRTVVTTPRSSPRQVTSPCGTDPAATLPLAPAAVRTPREPDRGSPVELAESEVPRPAPRRAEVVPLDADQRRLHLTVSKRFLAKLAAAADALAHTRPGVSEEELLEAGLDLLLARAAKRHGVVERPRKTREPANPAHVPAAVRRAVYLRDGGECQYRLASGGICGCTRHLQYDHVPPLALGGTSTVDGVRLACQAHNLLAARLDLGDAVMDRYTSNPRTPRRTTPASPDTQRARRCDG
jgi:5-methylcytosine-specific restriction endonuclease McrA